MGSSELKQRFEFEINRNFLRMKKKRVFLRRVLEGKKLESNLHGHTVSEKRRGYILLVLKTAVQNGTIRKYRLNMEQQPS